MPGATSDSRFGSSSEGTLSGEALAEWQSSEQVENGIPSTSPPYWDTDDDEDCGPKPSDMYGKYTWKIDKFSQINKRELRSNAFDVGSYKWYILIYPQGCDVCNHLSIFLCVANHDKLLPGWSHFAQFTIAVVNKDPKKSKYSDTLHRFWKKEHDWGWKKFMELSKVMDGFVEADTLIIKAQVQVIRERVDRPFCCLDSHYRRELVRVYLVNVEQICHRFMEERRSKLVKLIEDKARWSSFCGFWVAIDQNVKSHMSREKTDAILRVITKHFFIEKEVTSTLVMDSLYSGLRALEGQGKGNIANRKLQNAEELPVPIVYVDKDMFFLVDDVLKLLERVALETLPPKDDKGPQNHTKDGCLEDCSKDFVVRDERRLTELGHRTVEIFVLSHIFSRIEIAYQEAIALQRQEELIREEAAWLAETGQKAKCGGASEKEKKLKKKQAKQKRNNRKGKDKGKTDKPVSPVEDELLHGSPSDDRKELMAAVAERLFSKCNPPKCIVYPLTEVPSPDSEERDSSLASWDADTLEIHPVTDVSSSGVGGHSSVVQRGTREMNNPYVVDDTSSTCSTDSVPSVVVNGLYSGYSLPKPKTRKSVSRVKSQQGSATSDWVGCTDEVYKQSDARSGASKQIGSCGSGKAESESKADAVSTKGRKNDEQLMTKKEKVVSLKRESSIKARAVEERPSKEKAIIVPSSASIPSRTISSIAQTKPESKTSGPTNPVLMKKPCSDFPQEAKRHTSLINRAGTTCTAKPIAQKVVTQAPTNKPSVQPLSVVSRPLSAPIVPVPKPPAPSVSIVQTSPVTSHSGSSARQLRPGPSPCYPLQSYKNVMMGITQSHSSSSSLNPPQSHTETPNLVSATVSSPVSPDRVESMSSSQSLSFGTVNHDVSRNLPLSSRIPQREDVNDTSGSNPQSGSQVYVPMGVEPSGSERLSHSGLGDDFPHLDIINNLLDDEQGFMMERFQTLTAEARLQRHFSFPSEIAGMTNGLLASTSSCRFEQGCYDDGFQLAYGSLPGHFDTLELGDMIPQTNPSIYTDEQMDGFIPSPWLRDGSELSYYDATMTESDGYPYNFIEPANMACGVVDYSAFGPPNAH